MEAYTTFAQVYDLFMDNVPYEEWSNYIVDKLRSFGIEDGMVVDLGCGTGKMARMLAKEGYQMIGVDLSMDMLEIAREQEYLSEDMDDFSDEEWENWSPSVFYLLQDMRELELFEPARAIYSACDSINYIVEEADLLQTFQCVYDSLEEDGIFLFDFNPEYKYRVLLADNTFAENREESSFIWENTFDPETGINEFDLTLFCKAEDGRYERFEEVHYQKEYSLSTIRQLLEKAGFTLLAANDAYTDQEVTPNAERITVIARKAGK